MTELEAHRQWLHAGNDLYLCHTEEIAAGISKQTGCLAAGNGPLVDPGSRTTDSPLPRPRLTSGADVCRLTAGRWC
jgi:hypothetical protein